MPSGDGPGPSAERAAAAREADPEQQAHAADTAKWGAKITGIHAHIAMHIARRLEEILVVTFDRAGLRPVP